MGNLYKISLANWTEGSGITPSTDSDSLTNKAQFTASSADLTQAGILSASTKYEIIYTITRSAGSVTPKAGSVAGTARSAAGTYIDEITSDGTGLVFSGSSFTGTVDNISVRQLSQSQPDDTIIVRVDRDLSQCVLIKIVNGTYTVLIDESITYGDTNRLIALRDSTTNKVWVFYDSAQVGTEQTITDISIILNKNHFRSRDDGSGDFEVKQLKALAVVNSGTLTNGKLYKISATQADHFYVGCAIGDYFVSDGTETLDSNNKTRKMPLP